MKTVNHVCAHLSTMCPVYTRRQKKSKQKKRRPCCLRPLRFATGQPAVLGPTGVELELATLRQSLALIRLDLRSSAHTEG